MTDDPFETLGVEPRFDLDETDLHQRFIRATAAAHPDRYLDPLEQADAADRASQINHAYRVLSDPESRANALLATLGGPAKEDDPSLPPDLLMDMMEVREEMEAAIEANDSADLERLRKWAEGRRAEHLDRIAAHFGANDLAQVRLELNAMRYIERMLEQMPA